jgi:hypothetical protein
VISRPGQTDDPTRTRHRQTDPDLARIVVAWPGLPEAIKAGIVAMVKAASQTGH